MQCRLDGYYDLSAIDTAVVEASGKISFLPRAAKRPLSPEDMNIVPAGEGVFYNVIMDGKIMDKNLQSAGKDKNWLKNELKVQGYKKVEDIFIAVLDGNGTLNVFTVGEGKQKNDIYE